MSTKGNKSINNTPIEKIGKANLIKQLLADQKENLLDNTGYIDESGAHFINSHLLLLEGIDFNLTYNPLKHLGYKAIISAIGPLYASLHIPVSISLRIGLSARFFVEDILQFWEGVKLACQKHKIHTVGVDLLPSLTGLTVSLSTLGKQQKELFVQRTKAKSGDLICISGAPGAAYMGLQILERERKIFNETGGAQPMLEDYKFILQKYLSPELDASLPELLILNKIIPTEGEFLTKGVADAVKRICHRTDLDANIYLDKIPIASQTFAISEELGIDATTAALNGGDDMLLLYTVPLNRYEQLAKELPALDIIGHMSDKNRGACLITPDGTHLELKARDWID